MLDKRYVPTGTHYGLTIVRDAMEDAGEFTGGGWKLVWHTTEGASLMGAVEAVRSKRAAPHFIIDPRAGRVVQALPLTRAGRTLMHPSGPETNRANAIQVEVVGFASQTGRWGDSYYRHLAALALLIEHRVPVPRRAAAGVTFAHPRRLSGIGFVRAAGHLGHCHAPGNDHTDPGTGFDGARLRRYMKEVH